MVEFEVLADTPNYLIKLNPEVPCIMIKWRGDMESESYRKALNDTIIWMKERQVSKIINDDRKIKKGLSKQDQKWAMEDWLGRALDAGYQSMAIIQERDFFKRFPAAQLAASTRLYFQNLIKIEYFSTVKAAEDWIKVA
ncbi:hypothetical protein [Bernardetia sp.]|uniref:hypothetical protein n=1 Tax=Bernardetia sp. TaxID=1937974 RepID=UPI0025C449B9|nr:hypothetical protein [Bernardetia sp.]